MKSQSIFQIHSGFDGPIKIEAQTLILNAFEVIQTSFNILKWSPYSKDFVLWLKICCAKFQVALHSVLNIECYLLNMKITKVGQI